MKKSCLGIIVGLLVLLLSAACSSSPATYTLTGVLPDSTANGKTIYIVRQDDWKYVDTAIIQGDKFLFEGEVEEPAFCRVTVKSGLTACLILEKGHIVLDFTQSKYPSGTSNNDELARVCRMEDSQMKEFTKGMRQAIKERKRVKAYKEEYTQKLKNQAKELFKQHRNDWVGYYLLHSSYMNILDKEERKEVLESLGVSLQKTSRVQYLQKQLNK